MASLVEDLLAGMISEREGYEKLLATAEEKRAAIVAGNANALDDITAREEMISSDLKNLEKKRLRSLADMAVVLGHDGEQMTVSAVIEQLSSQPEEQKELTEARDALVECATRVQIANATNAQLLQTAMDLVEFDLTLYKSMRQAPETANYNKNAYNTGELLGSSSFDSSR